VISIISKKALISLKKKLELKSLALNKEKGSNLLSYRTFSKKSLARKIL